MTILCNNCKNRFLLSETTCYLTDISLLSSAMASGSRHCIQRREIDFLGFTHKGRDVGSPFLCFTSHSIMSSKFIHVVTDRGKWAPIILIRLIAFSEIQFSGLSA